MNPGVIRKSSMTLDIDAKIALLERKLLENGHVPGTSITRTLPGGNNARGFAWILGLGRMYAPKQFFEGATIEECIEKALKGMT